MSVEPDMKRAGCPVLPAGCSEEQFRCFDHRHPLIIDLLFPEVPTCSWGSAADVREPQGKSFSLQRVCWHRGGRPEQGHSQGTYVKPSMGTGISLSLDPMDSLTLNRDLLRSEHGQKYLWLLSFSHRAQKASDRNQAQECAAAAQSDSSRKRGWELSCSPMGESSYLEKEKGQFGMRRHSNGSSSLMISSFTDSVKWFFYCQYSFTAAYERVLNALSPTSFCKGIKIPLQGYCQIPSP